MTVRDLGAKNAHWRYYRPEANLDGDQEDGVPGRGDEELERRLCARKYKLKQAEVATVRLRLPTEKENEIK